MASYKVEAQLTDGSLALAVMDRFWVNGNKFGIPVIEDAYQRTSHITNQVNEEQCEPEHVNNTKYLTANTVSINGATSSVLPIPTISCALRYTFVHDVAVTIPSAQFYIYNGIDDLIPVSTLDFRAAEGGVSTSWVVANGKAAALNLVPRPTPAFSHVFYIALSASPTNLGEKTGKIKFLATYDYLTVPIGVTATLSLVSSVSFQVVPL